MDNLLWDHFSDLEITEKNYYFFVQKFKKNYVEVHYIEKFIIDILKKNINLNKKFIDLKEINLKNYISELINTKVKFIFSRRDFWLNQRSEKVALGTNVLILKQGTIFLYECKRIINKLLKKVEIEVIEIPSFKLKLNDDVISTIIMYYGELINNYDEKY